MKFLIIALTATLFVNPPAHAWKEVGDAGGASEQNLIYFAQNAHMLLASAGNLFQWEAGSESDKEKLTQFIKELEKTDIRFNYAESATSVFEKHEYVWILNSVNLGAFDLDGNLVLSYSEVLRLYLTVFSFENNSPELSRFAERLLHAFDESSDYQMATSYRESIGWMQVQDGFLFVRDETVPLHVPKAVFANRLCQGKFEDLKLFNAALTAVESIGSKVSLLLAAEASYLCDGRPANKKIFLNFELNTSKNPAQLNLR